MVGLRGAAAGAAAAAADPAVRLLWRQDGEGIMSLHGRADCGCRVWWGCVPLARLDRLAVMGALLRGFVPGPVKSCAASHGGTSHHLCSLRLGQAVCASGDFFWCCCHVHVVLAVTCVSLRKPGLRSGWCRDQTAAGLESDRTRCAAWWGLVRRTRSVLEG
jgi:hypothetical protein